MKKIAVIIICILVVITFFISIPYVNDFRTSRVVKELEELALPENTEYIESVSATGHLFGNGDGTRYLGCILVKSELSSDELRSYYSAYWENCLVENQTGQELELIELENISFKTKIDEDNYYSISVWVDGKDPFAWLDLRGA